MKFRPFFARQWDARGYIFRKFPMAHACTIAGTKGVTEGRMEEGGGKGWVSLPL